MQLEIAQTPVWHTGVAFGVTHAYAKAAQIGGAEFLATVIDKALETAEQLIRSVLDEFRRITIDPVGEEELRRANYSGPVGIDAFAYRVADGKVRLKPVVEINPRYTMGRLTVELMKHAAPGIRGLFRLISRKQALVEGFADFSIYARALSERFPLRLKGEPSPRISEGAICLNDPTQTEVCLAVFQVAHAAGAGASLADLMASNSSQRA